MDLKIKIVIVLFVMIFTGYLLYFIINKINKERSNEEKEKIITENFENYDIRKFILNELDTYSMNKKDKNIIYESLSKRIDELKDMPQDKIQSLIKDIVNDSKSLQETLNKDENNDIITEDYDDESTFDDDIEKYENVNDNEDLQKLKTITDDIDKVVAALNVSTDNIVNIKKELRDYITNKRSSGNNTNTNVVNTSNKQSSKQFNSTKPTKPTKPLRSTEIIRKTSTAPKKKSTISQSKNTVQTTSNSVNENENKQESKLEPPNSNFVRPINNEDNNNDNYEEFENQSIEGFKNYGGEWFSYI